MIVNTIAIQQVLIKAVVEVVVVIVVDFVILHYILSSDLETSQSLKT